jgi:hypothetical protein
VPNPLVETIENEFERLGLGGAQLIHESYSEERFGNAEAIYKLGDLYLAFIRDRSDDTVNFVNPSDRQNVYGVDDIALLMGWKTLDAMIERAKSIDFSKPPTGPVPALTDALRQIKQSYEELQRMFSPKQVGATVAKLKDVSKGRSKALFGRRDQ